MVLLQRLLRVFGRRRDLPDLPLVLPVLALISWVLMPLIGASGLPVEYRRWLGLADELLISYAALRLGLWLGLELPGGLGWWRRPPELLLQLLMLGGGTLLTVLVVRESARFDLIGLVTTSAVLTAVLGFAAQETLKDLFAGLELQLGDGFRVGDWLDVGQGVQGVVERITWRDTQLRNMEGCRLIVPNSTITAEVITNRSASGVASNRFELALDVDFPPARARALLEGGLQGHPRVLGTPAPRVRLKTFGESAVVYELQVWQKEMNMRAVLELRSELQEQIWYALRRAGQSLPFPVRELRPKPRTAARAAGSNAPEDALAPSTLFGILTADQRHRLTAAGRRLQFGPGEAIVVANESGDCLYQLLEGRVEVLKLMGPDRELRIRVLQPGELFGEMTLLLNEPRSATVRALEECTLLELDRSALTPILQAHPELLEQLAEQVRQRRQELDTLADPQAGAGDSPLVATMRRLFLAIKGGDPPLPER
jgi:small-conductance mechanosensitive channel